MIVVMPVWFGLGFFFFFPLSNLQQLEQIQKELSVLEEDIKRVEVRSRISYISSSFSISWKFCFSFKLLQ